MRILASILILLVAVEASAQVNIESRRLTRNQPGLSGSVNLSVELERGNSELTQVDLKPRLVARSGPSQWFMLNSYSLVETRQSSVINEGFSHLRYNYDLSERLLLEVLTQYQYNREQDLRTRLLLGTGLRLELVQRTNTLVAVGVTAMYEYEELETGDIIRTPRNSDYIAVQLQRKDNLVLGNTLYVQPAFDDIGDIRILDDLSLSVRLAKWLAITVSLEYRYDSEPPAGIKEYDLSLKNGVTVSF